MDGFCRRWVDVTWTAVPALRKLETDKVKYVYFATLMTLAALGLIIIWAHRKARLRLQARDDRLQLRPGVQRLAHDRRQHLAASQRTPPLWSAHRPVLRRLLLHLASASCPRLKLAGNGLRDVVQSAFANIASNVLRVASRPRRIMTMSMPKLSMRQPVS